LLQFAEIHHVDAEEKWVNRQPSNKLKNKLPDYPSKYIKRIVNDIEILQQNNQRF
jgi:hypothetical protein